MTVYATDAGRDILDANAVFGALDADLVTHERIALDTPISPLDGVKIVPFAVPGKVALYLEDSEAMSDQIVGLRIAADGTIAYYTPGCATVPDWLVDKMADADLIQFDGTA